MISLDFTQVQLDRLITHHIGNKSREEELKLSEATSHVNLETEDLLVKYFLHPFKNEELYHFYCSDDLESNELYLLSKRIFENHSDFVSETKEIAQILYEYSDHPKIKEGELNIAIFDDLIIGGELVRGIGIFKSETTVPFLKMENSLTRYSIEHEYGFEIKGIDKACIIFDTDQKNGFVVMAVDNLNKSKDAQFWKDEFLKLKPINNEYHMTAQILTMAKEFVTKQLPEDVLTDKTEQIDLLNRSVRYFKDHENYDKQEFEEEVLQNNDVIESFRNYDKGYQLENNVNLDENFEISDQAVKKQARIFKKVLKLDRNFHVYIHGDKDQIERGVEDDGRKYYKLYYTDEE